MSISRRALLGAAGTAAAAAALQVVPSSSAFAQRTGPTPASLGKGPGRVKLGVSSYSYWHFRPENDPYPIEKVIEHAASVGVEGVDILHRQMEREDNAYAAAPQEERDYRRRRPIASLHPTRASSYPGRRRAAEEHRPHDAVHRTGLRLGIPRCASTPAAGTPPSRFDELMKNKGIEPALAGYTDGTGLRMGHRRLTQLSADRREVRRGPGPRKPLGPGPRRQGVLRIVDAVNSPWLRACRSTPATSSKTPTTQLRSSAPKTPSSCRPRPTTAAALVHARPRLRPHRRDPRRAQLPRLHLAGVRRQGARPGGGAQGRRAAAGRLQGVNRRWCGPGWR